MLCGTSLCGCCVFRFYFVPVAVAMATTAAMNSRGEAKIIPRLSHSLSMKAINVGKSVDLSIANLLERETAEEQTLWAEELRLKVKKFIATSFFGHLYVNTLLVLSILSCLQYIYSTYLEKSPRGEVRLPLLLSSPSNSSQLFCVVSTENFKYLLLSRTLSGLLVCLRLVPQSLRCRSQIRILL
jgi:hypothetical protein